MSMETLQAHDELFARIFLALVTSATILYFSQLLLKRRASSPSLPSPRGLPIIGNLHQLSALPHDSLAELAAKHAAPLMLLHLGSVPTIVVSSAEAFRAVFQTNDRAVSGRPWTCVSTKLSYGRRDIIFTHPDVAWRAARRAAMSEVLSVPRVRSFRDVREGEAAALIATIADMSRSGSPVNLSEELTMTSNKIVRRIAFGDNCEESIEVIPILNETQWLSSAFFVADYLPWLGWLDALRGLRRRLEKNFSELDVLYEKVIDKHLDNQRSGVSDSKGEDLVDVLLRLHVDPAYQNTFNSRNQVKGILTDMFVAGTDTSTAVIGWAMTELLRKPDTLAKAQKEVRGAVAADRDIVRESDLPQLRYLKQVIRETMRLHPPAPLLVPRETIEPWTVYGCEIPVGTQVVVNAKAMGLDPDAWGPDAAQFAPERHEGIADLNDHKPWHDSFSLVPFGFGRRSCPGVHFSTSVVELLLANLLFAFDWRTPHGEVVDLEQEPGLAVHRKNPLVLVAADRRVV